MQICPDVISFPESPECYPDRWVIMNVFTRDCIGAGPEAIQLLGNPQLAEEKQFRVWDIWHFSHADGLLADPSRFRRQAGLWGEPKIIKKSDLVQILIEKSIFIDDLKSYRERFKRKKSILDKSNFGNYHEQLGQYLLTVARCDPALWWVSQKFKEGAQEIRSDNLYGAVQHAFLAEWLPKKIRSGQTVLDLGCGPGVISKMMANLGAKVLGIDPNAEFIALALKDARGIHFQQRNLDCPDILADLPDHSYDIIFMSDALLFYFVPYQGKIPADIQALVRQVKRLLKPTGSFLSLEPHPVFYLLPWLGGSEKPFTIITEYLFSQWRINPPLSILVKPFLQKGFVITELDELKPQKENSSVDPRALNFAKTFPLWLSLEMKVISND